MATGLQNRAVTVQRLHDLQQLSVRFPALSDDINDRPAAFADWTDIEAQASHTLDDLKAYCEKRNQIEPNRRWECREEDYVLELRYREVELPPKRRGRELDPESLTGRLRDIPVGGTTMLDAKRYPFHAATQAACRMRAHGYPNVVILGERVTPEGKFVEAANIGPGQERPAPRELSTLYPFRHMKAGDSFTVQNATAKAIRSIKARIYERNRLTGATLRYRHQLQGNDVIVNCFTVEEPGQGASAPTGEMKVLPIVRAAAPETAS